MQQNLFMEIRSDKHLKKPFSQKAFPYIIFLTVNNGINSNTEFKQIVFFISQPSSMNSTLDKKLFLKQGEF